MSSPLQSWWYFACAAQFGSCLVFSVKLVLRKMRSCMIVSMEKMKVGKFMKTSWKMKQHSNLYVFQFLASLEQ